jgi:hypothetical protein
MFKIYVKSNYFYIVDVVNNILFEGLSKNVRVRRSSTNSSSFTFDNVNGFTQELEFSNILGETGNAYSSIEDFISFYESNTGGV